MSTIYNTRKTRVFSSILKHRIEFLSQNPGTKEWEIYANSFAEITSLTESSLKEFDDINFGHLLQEEYFLITTRYKSGVDAKMRIKFKDRLFFIKRVINPYELNKSLKFIAQEITQ